MDKIYKPAKNFIDKNIDILLSKNTAFYVCNSYPDKLQKAIENNIPKKLIDAAICIKSLGGKPPFTSPKNQDWILMDNVNALAQAVTAKR
jgi:menaquinone-dependent protoporphyrinogen oxidase